MKSLINDYCGSTAISDGKRMLSDGCQRKYTQQCDAAGRTVLRAKYSDHFNFVDTARIVININGSGIDFADCSCPAFTRETGLCCHCAALLLKLEETTPALAYTVVETDPEPKKEASVIPPESVEETAETAEEAEASGIQNYTFRFCNSSKDLYPGVSDPEIPRERFEMIFGKKLSTRKLYDRYKKWNGSCYGIASACGLFVHPGNGVSVTDYRPDAARPVDLDLQDQNEALQLTLHSFIEAMFISQLSQYVGFFRNAALSIPLSDRIKMLTDAVTHFEQTGEDPVLIDIYEDRLFRGGHSVFPFRYEKTSELRSRLHIYDSNYPGQVRFCDLRRDKSGKYISWRFNMQKGKDYSSENGGMIDFVPRELYQRPWDERASKRDADTPKALFSTSCEDLTIRDTDGNDVMKIAAGVITPLRADVVPVRMTDGEAVADRYDVWIDQGRYHVLNDDPERDLEFSYCGEEVGMEVQTDAEEVIAEVNDEEHIQKIQIVQPKEKITVKKVLLKILSITGDILIRVATNYLSSPTVIPSILQALGKLFFMGFTYDSITEFAVNGEPANACDYITLEESESTENEDSDLYENTDENECFDEENLLIANKKLDPEA